MQSPNAVPLISLSRAGGVALAAVAFGLGWWLMLDGAISHSSPHHSIPWYGYIPAVSASVGVFMLNLASLDSMDTEGGGGGGMPSPYSRGVGNALRASLWMALWSLVLFGSLAGAISVMVVLSQEWNGVSLLLQPLFCIISAYVMLVCRRAPKQDDGF